MHSLITSIANPSLLGAATDFWVTKWLTPIWLLGVGVAAGLLLLTLVVFLLRGIAVLPGMVQLQGNRRLAHAFSAVLTVTIAAALYVAGAHLFENSQQSTAVMEGKSTSLAEALSPNGEQVLFGIATLMLSTVFGWGIVFGAMPKNASDVVRNLTDGVGSLLLGTCGILIVLALAASFVVDEPIRTLTSMHQLFTTGVSVQPFEIDGAEGDGANKSLTQISVKYDPELVFRVQVTSDRRILVADAPQTDSFEAPPQRIEAKGRIEWVRGQSEPSPISMTSGAGIYIRNEEADVANVVFTVQSMPLVRESMMILITAVAVLLVGMGMIAQTAVAPKLSAVALATAKSELGQPLFLVLMLIGFFSIIAFAYIPFFTFGEDTKLLKECGITVILLLASFQGIWAASGSVADEIEGRTALTVLSKPIDRRSFVIGKFVGIFWVLLLMFFALGAWELIWVAYKPLFEARETSEMQPVWQTCFLEMSRTVPGLVMGLMQATILTAISVAVSTRLPQLANFSICFAIYLIGNLTPTLVNSSSEQFEPVRFVAQLVAVVIPLLDHFSMQAAIDANNEIPFSLLCGNLIYSGLYILMAMFVALLFFEDRDLA